MVTKKHIGNFLKLRKNRGRKARKQKFLRHWREQKGSIQCKKCGASLENSPHHYYCIKCYYTSRPLIEPAKVEFGVTHIPIKPKKLKLLREKEHDIPDLDSDEPGDLQTIPDITRWYRCPHCKQGEARMEQENKPGHKNTTWFVCDKCGKEAQEP